MWSQTVPPGLNVLGAGAASIPLRSHLFPFATGIRTSRNAWTRSAVVPTMEMLLTILLVLMIPGLLTYLVPHRHDMAQD